jgi:hypothetical protein
MMRFMRFSPVLWHEDGWIVTFGGGFAKENLENALWHRFIVSRFCHGQRDERDEIPVCAYREEVNMPVNRKNGLRPVFRPVGPQPQRRGTTRHYSFIRRSLSRVKPHRICG